MSSITYASFANLINTNRNTNNASPSSSSTSSTPAKGLGSEYDFSTIDAPHRPSSPTPSGFHWDSPQPSHRSMPGTPDTETFSSMPSTRSPTPSPVNLHQRHSQYYFQDDIDEFLVEDCLFRVHRYHLDLESKSFPRRPDARREPIPLVGVTKLEFESLLDFFYKSMHNESVPPLVAWTSILSIATRYDMRRVRARAIKEIYAFRPRIQPIEQVVLAVAHNVPEWLPIAFAALCAREEPIQVDEAMKIGLEKTVKLSMAREQIRKLVPQGQKVYSVEMVNKVVFGVFWPGDEVSASVTQAVTELFVDTYGPQEPEPAKAEEEEEEAQEVHIPDTPATATILDPVDSKAKGKGKGKAKDLGKGKTSDKDAAKGGKGKKDAKGDLDSILGSGAATPTPMKRKASEALQPKAEAVASSESTPAKETEKPSGDDTSGKDKNADTTSGEGGDDENNSGGAGSEEKKEATSAGGNSEKDKAGVEGGEKSDEAPTTAVATGGEKETSKPDGLPKLKTVADIANPNASAPGTPVGDGEDDGFTLNNKCDKCKKRPSRCKCTKK